jgi:solute carrier family 25 (mitochondrial folate transporter), member 32
MTTNPIWVIKTRLMSQSSPQSGLFQSRSPWRYRNTLDAARKMYRNEGLRSFYSGLTPALLGLTHVAIQFPLYEVFKQKFTGLGAGNMETEDDRRSHFYGLAFAVFLSKVCASTATYPHEVVRTRLQTQQRSAPTHSSEGIHFRGGLEKLGDHGRPPGGASSDGMINRLRYRGTLQTCQTILAEEGWRGFYAGLGTNLIRAVPSAMTTILTFEYLKKTFYDLQREGRAKTSPLSSPAR